MLVLVQEGCSAAEPSGSPYRWSSRTERGTPRHSAYSQYLQTHCQCHWLGASRGYPGISFMALPKGSRSSHLFQGWGPWTRRAGSWPGDRREGGHLEGRDFRYSTIPSFSGSAMIRVVMLPSPIPKTTDLQLTN